ncbi:LysR family transcriptional regulator [Roseibium sp. RKSG952]|uniref:LysR family transcriptional regulator n=1 Tax=Roseibium sp. RKSG952 TaxID=2529384 RepID=UPI0012BC3F56|nr:LysR family transcriptional regulator [Roseibium sp. RKSG952]MTI00314.1 LysR family transcriptional regulator [Roseibium sp. RKSG952]
MKQSLNWQDVSLFLSIARHGGLAGAARETGLSAATLGRRMLALEEAVNRRLFERGARGYALTEAGTDFLSRAADMESAARTIDGWCDGQGLKPRVRISAGDWTMRLIIDHADRIWQPEDMWSPEFLSDLKRRDIARRQVDIGIRNARPTEPWLAGQRVGHVTFCVYRAARFSGRSSAGWIGLSEDQAQSPTAQWIETLHGRDIVVRVNNSFHAVHLMQRHNLLMLLPCFVGDAFTEFQRVGEPVKDLTTERWLVLHQDARYKQPIREAAKAIAGLLKENPRLVSHCRQLSLIPEKLDDFTET